MNERSELLLLDEQEQNENNSPTNNNNNQVLETSELNKKDSTTSQEKELENGSKQLFRTFNKYQDQPKTCFDLVDKINSKGRYQTLIFLISLSEWFIGGFLILVTSFLFMNVEFDCQNNGLLVKKCKQAVCSLPSTQWSKYVGQKYFQSLATEFGPYYCDDQQILHIYTISVFVGAFVGSIIFSFLADNYGRKFSMMISWGCTCFGLILMCIAFEMWIGAIGVFISGAGGKGSFRNSNLFMTQMVEQKKRQKYLTGVQIFYAFSGVFIGVIYFLVRDWRIITIVFITVPSLIIYFIIWRYLQETPKFILKKPVKQALQIFKKIAMMNKVDPIHYVRQSDIQSVIQQQEKISLAKLSHSKSRIVNHLDLLKFESLRINSICCWIISIMITFLYSGPSLIVSSFGLSPFLAQIVIGTADVLACLLTFWKIEQFPRVKTGLIFSFVSLFCTTILVFVEKPEQCHNCWQGIFQLIFIFISRFFLSAYFAIFVLHCLELYPESIRAIGTSTAFAVGILSPIAGPFLFNLEGLNTMLVFTVATVLNILAIWFLPETLGKPLKEEIEEMIVPNKESILTVQTQTQRQKSLMNE